MPATLERAREAFDRRAWLEARDLLRAAEADGPLDPGDLERLAVASNLAGDDDGCTRAWELAHRACLDRGDPAEAARCAFWLGMLLMMKGDMARSSGWLGRARRLVDDGGLDCTARGYLLVPEALMALGGGDAPAAQALFADVTDTGRRLGDDDLLAFGRLGSGQAAIASGDTARGVALLDEVMVAVTTGEVSPVTSGIVYCAVIEACMFVFDLRRAAEWTEALRRWCDAQPDLVPYRGQCLVHRSQILLAHGDWDEAVSEVERARVRLSDPPHPAAGLALYQHAELQRLRGELDEAAETYRLAGEFGVDVAPGLPLLQLARGDVAGASAAIRRAVDENDDAVTRPPLLAASVEIAVAAGDVAGARVASDELSGLAGGGAPLLRAIAEHAAGSVLLAEGDPGGALTALRRACAGWRELEMPYDVARARTLIGAALRAMGDRATGDVELAAAGATFERLGARPDVERVTVWLGDRSTAPAPLLTDRECEVLRLVAGGKTNREIGVTLVISEHTVARHLQNIFSKLGVSSRAAATAYAYEHGVV